MSFALREVSVILRNMIQRPNQTVYSPVRVSHKLKVLLTPSLMNGPRVRLLNWKLFTLLTVLPSGENTKALIQAFVSTRLESCVKVRASHSIIVLIWPLAKRVLSGENANAPNFRVCPVEKTDNSAPVFVSHIRILPLGFAVTTVLASGENTNV